MKITLKISLIIVVAVGLVYAISTSYGPRKSENRPAFTHSAERPAPDNVPRFLQRSFPDTDFSKSNSVIEQALSGGPAKDGIPAIDEPTFTTLSEFVHPDSIQAIVIADGNDAKVYPYNILTWHEIVNDTVAGVPIAVTFCPLCGSAIVFERTLPNGPSTFGVSGALIESNMVMYDRQTETLWQQSTGEALAGELYPAQLELHPFQLLTMGDIKKRYPNALVLSEQTGFRRDYGRNPYSGYTENEQFFFALSDFDARYPQKSIMAVFRVGDVVAATPWTELAEGTPKKAEVADVEVTLERKNGELTITDASGTEYPFFFEMWFSFAAQNPDGLVIE